MRIQRLALFSRPLVPGGTYFSVFSEETRNRECLSQGKFQTGSTHGWLSQMNGVSQAPRRGGGLEGIQGEEETWASARGGGITILSECPREGVVPEPPGIPGWGDVETREGRGLVPEGFPTCLAELRAYPGRPARLLEQGVVQASRPESQGASKTYRRPVSFSASLSTSGWLRDTDRQHSGLK